MQYNIYKGEILPNSLSKNETINFFKKMNKGNKTARNKLIEHNLRLVTKMVTKYFYNTGYDIEDLISIGQIGLIKAVDTFDITKNINFATYAGKCINNEILTYLNINKKELKKISIEETISTDNDGNEQFIKDTLTDDTNIELDYENSNINSIIREIVEELPEREKEITKLFFGFYDKRYNQKEIADKFNLNQGSISKIIKNKILPKIKNKLEKLDIVETETIKNKTLNINNQ